MKQYPWKFKLCWDGIEWYQTEVTLNSDYYFYYFKVDWMNKQNRDNYHEIAKNEKYWKTIFGTPTIGLHKCWYDCPHAQLNLHWIVFYWSTQWTTMPKDKK
jgi:hypothetical protein